MDREKINKRRKVKQEVLDSANKIMKKLQGKLKNPDSKENQSMLANYSLMVPFTNLSNALDDASAHLPPVIHAALRLCLAEFAATCKAHTAMEDPTEGTNNNDN